MASETRAQRHKRSEAAAKAKRERHREQIAEILGDVQIELDRRRADERVRVEAFKPEETFSWAATNATIVRPPGRVSLKLKDIAEQAARDDWDFRA